MSDEKPFTTGDVARLLHISLVTVLLWIRAGKLKAYCMPGRHYRIAQAEFRKFLTDNQIPVSLDAPAPRRVLVVDDEASVREAFAAALRKKGYDVVLARDGREALKSLRREKFDLIFLDILLPHVGGASVLKAIKRREPEAIVVLITGYPYHDETLSALDYGPAMLLPKPVKLADIEAVLQIVFKK